MGEINLKQLEKINPTQIKEKKPGDRIDIKQLERVNPIIQIATELGISVRGSVGKCFNKAGHPEDNDEPTLFFKPGKNTFLCKTCREIGGSVIDLVCQVNGWDREKAVEWLSHRNEFDLLTKKLYCGKGKKK
jgi:hypothetical protein